MENLTNKFADAAKNRVQTQYQIAADIWNNTAPENRVARFKLTGDYYIIINSKFESFDMYIANAIIDVLRTKGYFA
jgi:hypothetical protein